MAHGHLQLCANNVNFTKMPLVWSYVSLTWDWFWSPWNQEVYGTKVHRDGVKPANCIIIECKKLWMRKAKYQLDGPTERKVETP